MEVNEQQFWESLRRSIDQAEAAEAEVYAEAERELAQAGDEAVDALRDEQIDAMVRHAVGAEPAAIRADRTPAGRIQTVPARPPVRRFLAAAVALFLTPQFLAAATVVTAVAATAFVLQRTTQTLVFQDAVHRLVDDRESAANRDAAQGTVYGDLIEGVDVLQLLTEEPTPLAEQARGALQRLRRMLDAADPFVRRRLPGSPMALGDQALDQSLPFEVRSRALAGLAELMAYGVSALQDLERRPVPVGMRTRNDLALSQLAQRLR
jgi:hypothetical protein